MLSQETVCVYIPISINFKSNLLWESTKDLKWPIVIDLSSEFLYYQFIALELYIALKGVMDSHLHLIFTVDCHHKHPWPLRHKPIAHIFVPKLAKPIDHYLISILEEWLNHEVFEAWKCYAIWGRAKLLEDIALELSTCYFEAKTDKEVFEFLVLKFSVHG